MTEAPAVRGLARSLRRLPDRLLHPLRRRATLRRLARKGPPGRLLFVCHGNICRSPYAAAALERRLPPPFRERVVIDSAGFVGPGRPAPQNAVAVAAYRGIDLSTHRSKLVALSDGAGAELVVVMEPRQGRALRAVFGRSSRNIVVLGDLDPLPIATRAIADPVDQELVAFEESYARIDRCLQELVGALFPHR